MDRFKKILLCFCCLPEPIISNITTKVTITREIGMFMWLVFLLKTIVSWTTISDRSLVLVLIGNIAGSIIVVMTFYGIFFANIGYLMLAIHLHMWFGVICGISFRLLMEMSAVEAWINIFETSVDVIFLFFLFAMTAICKECFMLRYPGNQNNENT